MSLQLLWSLYRSHPAQVVNGLALLLALAGGWLLLATRWREQRAALQVREVGECEALADGGQVERLNRFFYAFGALSLGAALLLSWFSCSLTGAASF